MSAGGFPPAHAARPFLDGRPDESLDPEDWDALRALGHRMVDDMVAFHAGLAGGPAWQSMPAAMLETFGGDPPRGGQGEEVAYEDFRRRVLPYSYGNTHPRAWGWVNGNGTTFGALSAMLAAAMNPNCWGGHHAAAYVEAEVLDWLKTLLRFPASASGLLVSGASVANLVGLAAARDDRGGEAVASRGLQANNGPLVVYASEQAHNSIDKAVALLGIGTANLRHVPTTADYRLDVEALSRCIASDRAAGCRPIAVVGTAGTVNTGAIDGLAALADVCEREDLWFHVDGAFGALAVLSPALGPLVDGIERAHSIAFDLHKWLHIPIEAGCILVRDEAAHRRPFSPDASYLAHFDRGVASGPHDYSRLGPQLTRGFRALKVWLSLKAHGTETYARLVEQNVRQARMLEDLILASPDLQLAAPVPLNVVCFRYAASNLPEPVLEAINRETLLRIQESGVAVPSSTVLRGRFVLRVAFTNHRTTSADLTALVDAVAATAREVHAERLG